ncbi:hypothetical protein BELL_0803g00010 [Botrytis elliptica]|uniref:Uncharacterized protein n=1 Tax=Botrytis elliptica TaxID=278938 RepID=A0A4Z1J5L7_9HELO|nr:hypothetical protein EAE99_011592 [Botrytis elliptica]TGO68871.1 hypothetical protein BELL_0803g00010 [Botrytis elliptica]
MSLISIPIRDPSTSAQKQPQTPANPDSLPTSSPMVSSTSNSKLLREKLNKSNSGAVSSSPSSQLCTAVIDLIMFCTQHIKSYNTPFPKNTTINPYWCFDEVDDGRKYLRPTQEFRIEREDIVHIIDTVKQNLKREDWETVKYRYHIMYSYEEGWFRMAIPGPVHNGTRDNIRRTIQEAARKTICSIGKQASESGLEINVDTEQSILCFDEEEKIEKRCADVALKINKELPSLALEVEHSQTDHAGYDIIHQYLTQSVCFTIKIAFAVKIGYKAGSDEGLEVIWTRYQGLISGDEISSKADTSIVLRDESRKEGSMKTLDSYVFDLSIQELLPQREGCDWNFTKEILDARVCISGRDILQCVIDAEEEAKKISIIWSGPMMIEGKKQSAFIRKSRQRTVKEDE